MRYFSPFILAITVWACQGTKQTATMDYNLLNGVWEGDCSMAVTGEFKGELECPIMEMTSLTTIALNAQHEGVWVYQRDDNRPDTTKAKLIMRDKQAILQMERRGEQWEREIFSVTQDSLKVYTSDREYVGLYRRKR